MYDDSLRLLVIEDDDVFRALAFEVLDGHTKIGVSTGYEGIEKYKDECPDITFLDLGLPDIDGFTVLRQIMSYDPEAFVVILSQSRFVRDVEKAKELGAQGYIIKPFSRKKVRDYFEKFRIHKERLEMLSAEEKAELYEKSYVPEEELEAELEHLHAEEPEEEAMAIEPPANDEQEEKAPGKMTRIDVMNSWQILFVDDFFTNRTRAQQELKKLGCKVDIAKDGLEAKQMAEAKEYNLIFMDSKMPELDGYEATAQIHSEINKDVTIIGLIENQVEIDTQKWRRCGMSEYIEKPASFNKLKTMIEKYIKMQMEDDAETFIG